MKCSKMVKSRRWKWKLSKDGAEERYEELKANGDGASALSKHSDFYNKRKKREEMR